MEKQEKQAGDSQITKAPALNENPRANENMADSTDEPITQQEENSSVGSEITDGEAG